MLHSRTLFLTALALGPGVLAGCWPDADQIRQQRPEADAADVPVGPDVVEPEPRDARALDLAGPRLDTAMDERAPLGSDVREAAPSFDGSDGARSADAPWLAPEADSAAEVAGKDTTIASDATDGRAVLDANVAWDTGVDAGRDASVPEATASEAGGTSVAERCAAWAQAWCGRYQACTPSEFAYTYLAMQTCIERMSLDCGIYAGLAGATWPTADCVRGTANESCADFRNELRPNECYCPGRYPDGETCAADEQCAGLRCTIPIGATCGKCGPLSASNGSCDNDGDCQRGLVCGGNVCQTPGALDAACSELVPCQRSLICSAVGKCSSPGGVGAKCRDSDDCDFQIAGTACNVDTGLCMAFQTADHDCGFQMDSTYTFCGAGGVCDSDSGGSCIPPAAPGSACDIEYGPDCLYPVTCDSKLGLCTMPSPSRTCVAPLSGSATNVAAELTGALVGDPSVPNTSLRKVLPIAILGTLPSDLEVGTAWGISGGSITIYYVVPITNVGPTLLCDIQVSKLLLADQAGATVASDLRIFAGSVAAVGGVWQHDCLKPYEVGYIVGLSSSTDGTNPFAVATSMQLGLAKPSEGTAVGVQVQPTGYTVTSSSDGSIIAATVKNTGTLKVALDAYLLYILFDDVGPVAWNFLEAPASVATLAVGESTTLTTPYWAAVALGSGTHVRIVAEVIEP